MSQPSSSPTTLLSFRLPVDLNLVVLVHRYLKRNGYQQLRMVNKYTEVAIEGIAPPPLPVAEHEEIPDLGDYPLNGKATDLAIQS